MTTHAQHRAWRGLGRSALAGLREGTVKFRDLTGLTDAELGALCDLADSLRRQRRHADARSILALVLLQDPLAARAWRAMAELHRGLGDHAVALACHETAALVGGRDLDSTRSEAASLEALGLSELIPDLQSIASAQAAAERRPS